MTDWLRFAKECGFDEAAPLDVSTLTVLPVVRETCASDKCHAYDHNWTCPPACGTLEECEARMRQNEHGFLLQAVGHMEKRIDTKCYMETEKRLHEGLLKFSEELKKTYPNALVLGAGGCRVCKKCAYPEPCRFPEKAISSMEAYGLFVSRVCKDNNVNYYYGPKTIAFTGCVLF